MGAGDFVWYDLMTTDTSAAIAFYTEVIGWSTQEFPNSKGAYQMWVGSEGPLGGTMILPDEAKKMGAPPHWMSNVVVSDLDASVARVKTLGGRVYKEPEGIPTVGRFAVIGDPQGGVLSLFQPDNDMAPHDQAKQGEFSWRELAAEDHEAALRFYGELLGWKLMQSMDMGPMGSYLIFGVGDKQLGGIFRRPPEMPMTAWLYYIRVDDLDGTIAKARERGATLLNGPMDVPGGRVAQLSDPQGAMFALHTATKG